MSIVHFPEKEKLHPVLLFGSEFRVSERYVSFSQVAFGQLLHMYLHLW